MSTILINKRKDKDMTRYEVYSKSNDRSYPEFSRETAEELSNRFGMKEIDNLQYGDFFVSNNNQVLVFKGNFDY